MFLFTKVLEYDQPNNGLEDSYVIAANENGDWGGPQGGLGDQDPKHLEEMM